MSENRHIILFLSIILIISAIIDLRTQKIPNLITFPAMVISIAYFLITEGISGLLFSTSGMVTGIAIFIIPYLMGGMGAGDAKLMGAVGAALGTRGVFDAFIFTAIIGGFYALLILLLHRDFAKNFITRHTITLKTFIFTKQFVPIPENKNTGKPRLSYGIAIALGTFTYIGLEFSGKNFLL